MIRLFLGFLIWGIIGNASMALAVVGKKASKPIPSTGSLASPLVPHRAVYEISLANKKQAVSVSDVKGRMVFEVTGSPCEGYTQNMRMVTRITDQRGKQTLSDIRSSTWEKGSGGLFRFTSSQYFDRTLQEIVTGTATRGRQKANIAVKIKNPSAADLDLPGDVLFPIQHSLAILSAAKTGKKKLDVRIYDGSEQGQGFYQTYSFVGKKSLPPTGDVRKNADQTKALARLGLASMPSWPVAISYFSGQGSNGDVTPSYELSFRLYPNGVSRNLLINYGDFAVRGSLDRIKYLQQSTCKGKKPKK